MKPQTCLKDAKVIKKIRHWTIETYTRFGKTAFAVCDGWYVDYPLLVDVPDCRWYVAYDSKFRIPKDVRKQVEREILKRRKIQNEAKG